ncbi:hypothetical protein TRFO_38970 [Tritrichomonas foetus]|uniref:DUF4455 domain-containing protein n=1 Tax=Tritrichomonas foetus TaxID=1144522 RepID=A0A1J4JBL6_9EUKA|nr:hypothetical protein TRFO_38970 [Tritrichomonas foetus]|eukprot:OHS94829.1 hypothetical protein TRFO_38970 [Tritrichomonas foetus]
MSSFAQMKVNSPSRPTSSTAHGKLTQFQEKLLLRYQNYIKVLQDRAETVAKKSNDDLQNRMNQFLKKKGEILGVREQILSSMDNAEKTFDELRINLNETRESLKSEVDSLHHDALSIYESSFQSLRPDIEKSINDTKDIEPQLPDYSKGKLEHEIQCLNKKFLETKKMLISTLYQIEQSILNDCENAEDQFEEKTNMYHENHFIGLLKIVKESLNPEKPIDYSELCKQFYNDEQKFVQCLTKQIQGINIFSPPNNFSDEELDFWMKGCNNILEMHNIFLDQFKEKFKEHTQAVDNDNIALVE